MFHLFGVDAVVVVILLFVCARIFANVFFSFQLFDIWDRIFLAASVAALVILITVVVIIQHIKTDVDIIDKCSYVYLICLYCNVSSVRSIKALFFSIYVQFVAYFIRLDDFFSLGDLYVCVTLFKCDTVIAL